MLIGENGTALGLVSNAPSPQSRLYIRPLSTSAKCIFLRYPGDIERMYLEKWRSQLFLSALLHGISDSLIGLCNDACPIILVCLFLILAILLSPMNNPITVFSLAFVLSPCRPPQRLAHDMFTRNKVANTGCLFPLFLAFSFLWLLLRCLNMDQEDRLMLTLRSFCVL